MVKKIKCEILQTYKIHEDREMFELIHVSIWSFLLL